MSQLDPERIYDFGRFEVPADNTALIRKARRGNKAAREEVVSGNLKLVLTIARDYRGKGLELADLIQEGAPGLMLGVERFDPKRGTELSTFAAHWIRHCIRRGLENAGTLRPYRLPVYVYDVIRAIGQARKDLEGKLFRDATDEELWAHVAKEQRRPAHKRRYSGRLMRLPRAGFFEILEAMRFQHQSKDKPVKRDEGESIWLDRVAAQGEDAEERLDARRRFAQDDGFAYRVIKAVRGLPDKQRAIVVYRYGLHAGPPATLQEAGMRIGYDRRYAHKLEGKALNTLRIRLKLAPRQLEDALSRLEDVCCLMGIDLASMGLFPPPEESPQTQPVTRAEAKAAFAILCEHLILLPTGVRNVNVPVHVLMERTGVDRERGRLILAELKRARLVKGALPWRTLEILRKVPEPKYSSYR